MEVATDGRLRAFNAGADMQSISTSLLLDLMLPELSGEGGPAVEIRNHK